MLNQPNSTRDTEAGYCCVCKNGLLNKAAFKGHVFTASVLTRSLQRAQFANWLCKFIINLQLNSDLCCELEEPPFWLGRQREMQHGVSKVLIVQVCTLRSWEVSYMTRVSCLCLKKWVQPPNLMHCLLLFRFYCRLTVINWWHCQNISKCARQIVFFLFLNILIFLTGHMVSCFCFCHTRSQLYYQHGTSAWDCMAWWYNEIKAVSHMLCPWRSEMSTSPVV